MRGMKKSKFQEAIEKLRGIGFSLRSATVEEKRGVAREAKRSRGRRYANRSEIQVQDCFLKDCQVVWKEGYFLGIFSPKEIIDMSEDYIRYKKEKWGKDKRKLLEKAFKLEKQKGD